MNTTSFYAYLLRALTTAELVEVSDLFPKKKINQLFIKEIDELLKDLPTGPATPSRTVPPESTIRRRMSPKQPAAPLFVGSAGPTSNTKSLPSATRSST
jgi:hypothetical protein